MNLLNVLRNECVRANAQASSRDDVLATVAKLAKQSSLLSAVDEKAVLQALTEREELSTTGFGNGIAIPHCRVEGVDEFVVGILTVPGGVDFDAMDGQPVKLFVFIVGPADSTNEHIKILSGISQVLNVPQNIEEMLAASDSSVLAESFLRHVRDETDSGRHDSKNLFRIQILDEDLFHDVLQIIEGFPGSIVMVSEAEPASNYLQKIPMFAGFWNDKNAEFCKVILATVEKTDTNETIRRIEQHTGLIDDRNDMLLTVQELFYCSGSLNI